MTILVVVGVWIGVSILFGLLTGKIIHHNEVCYDANAKCCSRR